MILIIIRFLNLPYTIIMVFGGKEMIQHKRFIAH